MKDFGGAGLPGLADVVFLAVKRSRQWLWGGEQAEVFRPGGRNLIPGIPGDLLETTWGGPQVY